MTKLALLFFALALARAAAAERFFRGDLIRLTRAAPLKVEGKETSAAKGSEFALLRHDAARREALVEFLKDDGTLVAATLPAEAIEATPPEGWRDLHAALAAFRDQRHDDARRLLARAAQDKTTAAIAAQLAPRLAGALTTASAARSRAAPFTTTIAGLRDAAAGLEKLGRLSAALALDEGLDRLHAAALGATAAPPPSKLDRATLAPRAATANRAVARARQALGARQLTAAGQAIDEGLAAEPGRPELAAMQPRIERDLAEVQSRYEAADKMRRHGKKGVLHAITAIEMGLKVCVDHPRLRALKKEMEASFEERTAPPIDAAFLAAAGKDATRPALEEGRKLYTSRCTECHDLELLDSRTIPGWRDIVGGMARRAKLEGGEQARILDYLAAAQRALDAQPPE